MFNLRPRSHCRRRVLPTLGPVLIAHLPVITSFKRNALPVLAAGSLFLSGVATAMFAAGSPARNWTADNGNGTYSNPLFHEEFEDPDIIRVGDDYYLAGTTMHM